MLKMIPAVLATAGVLAPVPGPLLAAEETRCGWLVNPTPANWWLIDADGEWTIGEQGGYQAPGFEDAPWGGQREQVPVNGNYGYECACMAVTSDADTMTITRVVSIRSRPLSACRQDRELPSMDG